MKRLLCLSMILAAMVAASCGKKQTREVPSPEFATYVSAYTGGVISASGTVVIELTRAHADIEPNTPIKEKLFSFTPSVKGEARWTTPSTIEFTPKEGALKSGTTYTVEFKLGKIEQVEKGLEVLKFSFRTRSQDFEVALDPGIITTGNPTVMRQGGTIAFGDVVDAAAVERMLHLGNCKAPALEPASGKGTSFKFTFDGIARPSSGDDATMELTVKGKETGIDRKEEVSVTVPAEGPFRLVAAGGLHGQEEGVYMMFSEPLDAGQDLKGLIGVEGVDEYTQQVGDNVVKIFFQGSRESAVRLTAHEGIRSADGRRTESTETVSLFTEAEKPAVEILSEGIIMPDAKNLTLRFRAVSLRTVDLKIIRIFESNVLMFLQTNKLDGDDELRRAGRMIHNKPLELSGPVSSGQWQDYEVDLTSIVKQEPGAIYRIELSFRRSYSTYPCGGRAAGAMASATEGLVPIALAADEEEDSAWDEPQPWYYSWYDEDEDGESYNWRERDDPCKATYYMSSDRKARCNVMASNLGVIVKSGAQRKAWVAVTDILSTKPVGDATIKVYNYQLQLIGEGRTDSQGMAEVAVRGVGFAAVVEKDGHKTYVKMTDAEQNSLSRFDVGGKQIQKGLKGYAYGERGVWRPGDTLFLTLVLEDRMKKLPDNHPVTLELFNSRGQFHTRQVNARAMNGFYSFTVPTSDEDPTGVWNAYFKVGGASFHKPLRVETIKPNRLKINFKIPNDRIEATGRTNATLNVSWLTGATARNLKGAVEMTLVRGGASPFKGYERFMFSNPASSFSTEDVEVWKGQVDGEGRASVSIAPPDVESAPGMLRADVVCRVFEPGGDASIYVESFPLSPFPRYVGVDVTQKPGEYYETNRANAFDVVTVNSSGNPVDARLEWKVYKMRWSWWWHKGDESLESYVNGNYADPVAEGKLSTAMGRGKLSFQVDYPEWGRYLIYVKDPNGGHASGGIVYVDWPSSYGRAQRSDPEGASMLTFTLDKPSYEVGETATVVIPGSAGGRALVSFENGSTVLSGTWVEMASSGDTKYSFKVTPEMAPNFYVHISLLQPHGQTQNSSPIRMYGIMPVEVSNKASVLEPVIAAPDVLRPQTEFSVRVSEKNGHEMAYTLAVVDEGLLDLTNFKTPNAWKEFYAREALGVRTWDMFDYVMGAYGGRMGALLSIGGDEALKPAERKANRFKPVVKFLGPFTLKKGSSNTHKITLPMYVGSVRVMVVAGGGTAYGAAEKAIPVRTPLMVLPTLPRVVSIGEQITMPVNVFAMEPDVKNVTLKAEVTGGLEIVKDKSLTINFAKPGDEMARFRLRAADVPGVATVKVTATCGKHTASEVIEIAVRNPNPVLVTLTDTLLAPGASITLPYRIEGEPNAENRVAFELSTMPQVELTRRYDYLSDYQHLCTEQLTSRGMPMLYLSTFRDVDKKEAEKITKGVQDIIRQIYSRQLSNGAFAYWPGYAEANEWIASYAGNFLLEARQKGYEVNDGVIRRWKEFQRRTALGWSMPRERDRQYYYYYQPDLVQAYRLYTLALAGSPETGAMNRMKEMDNISVAARWRLAAAYALSGKQKAASEVVAGIKSTVETYTSGHGYTYGSAERDAAMILDAMVAMGDMTAAMRQARTVSDQMRGETYLSTQSTAFSLAAMGSLAAKLQSGSIECAWTLDGRDQKAVTSAKAIAVKEVPVIQRAGEITLTNRGKGDLFVSLVCRTRPLVDTRPAQGSNLALSVRYVDLAGAPLRPDSLGQGTDLKALVTVTNTSGITAYNDIALTHIVPSGWEIFNERIATSDETFAAGAVEEESTSRGGRSRYAPASEFTYRDIRDDRVLTYFDLRRGESKTFTIRLQAAYAGQFILPAIECEAMYDPTARARTSAGTATVK